MQREGREGAGTRKAFGEIRERGCAVVMNFSSGLKCNFNAGISALGSCSAVAVGCFLAIDAQRVKAKVGCAALGGGKPAKRRCPERASGQEREDF